MTTYINISKDCVKLVYDNILNIYIFIFLFVIVNNYPAHPEIKTEIY